MVKVVLVQQEINKERNMDRIIIEVGSTVTKVDKYDGKTVERIQEKTIFF